jgi:triosephosphate isomerase
MNRRYRKTVVAGNWKMNKSSAEAKSFISELKNSMRGKWCDVVLCVPFTDIPAAVKAAKGSRIDIAAQNCHFAPEGAYTGEISCAMLVEAGVKYVVVGHSERRRDFGESDRIVNLKVHAAMDAGLRPIICVGESAEMRETGITIDVIRTQVKSALKDITADKARRTLIAYEPIWAIGTGNTATAEQADEVNRAIRECLRQLYGARAARSISILYGGSVTPKNAHELFAMPDIDGGLVGGASLDRAAFEEIINAADQ